ncbi:MAG: iron transporter [Actinobacteria bacterium]|nr:MAG: iron transporter [Actinomycetota bacterium]
MGSAFLIMLREGLEMALIVAIVLAYLRKTDRDADARMVWYGALAAAAIAIGAGAVIFAVVGDLSGRAEQIVEGTVAFAAAGVLTWMVFWMRQQARTIKTELQHRVDRALASGSAMALAGLAFFAILREGLETALLLLGSAVGSKSSASAFAGGVAGLAIAVGLGYLIYNGSRRVNLRQFFQVTGVLVLLFAAGLLARGVHEFQETRWIGTLHGHLWTIHGAWLSPDGGWFGKFLESMFGWNPSPSLEMVLIYFAYAVPVGFAFLSGSRAVPAGIQTMESKTSTSV